MKKAVMKITALLMALVMCLSLTACGSFEARLAKAVKKMNDAKNMHMDMEMGMTMSMSILGQNIDLDVDMDMDVDFQKKPMTAKMDMTMSMLGMTQNILYYMEQDGDGYIMYLSEDDGKSWTKQEMEPEEAQSQMSMTEGVKLFLDCAKNFQEAGEETVNGSQAWRYDGVIDDEYLDQALEMTGMSELLENSFGGESGGSGVKFSGSIPTSIWIDKKTGMISRYKMDMTEVMNGLMDDVIAGIQSQYGLDGINLNLEIKNVVGDVYLSNFNQVDEIVIPDAARAA